eukprot:10765339-Alexandrium_andersonii.AAC.1
MQRCKTQAARKAARGQPVDWRARGATRMVKQHQDHHGLTRLRAKARNQCGDSRKGIGQPVES